MASEATKALWKGMIFELKLATRETNLEGVKKAIKDGANLNHFTNSEEHPSLLHMTETFKSPKGLEILELLLKSGANPNRKNSFGCTPLHNLALDSSDHYTEEITEIFCKNGATVDMRNAFQETPFCKFLFL